MNRSIPTLALFCTLSFWTSVQAQPMADPPDRKAVAVARIASTIPDGASWGTLRYQIGCIYSLDLAWNVGKTRINIRGFEQPIREELKREGLSVAGDAADPFKQTKDADISIAAIITHIDGKYCLAYLRDGYYGTTEMNVDWQIYSNIERKVIATVHTSGRSKTDTPTRGGIFTVLIGAMDESVKQLTASKEFKAAISAAPPQVRPSTAKADNTPLPLPGALAAQPVKISDAVGSVLLILSGDGHGSGFLVSSDGYVMTAQHVVGTDKYVKVRWSDGLEGLGEVVRSDRRRDVALLKVDPRGRAPLALHRAAPEPGDPVFAIGAPLDPKLQSTVTRGVASANRIVDGFAFIQSDVTVDPGDSGGPLLDDKGQVLGITDFVRTDGDGDLHTGLNFFVPINDALLFLSAEPR